MSVQTATLIEMVKHSASLDGIDLAVALHGDELVNWWPQKAELGGLRDYLVERAREVGGRIEPPGSAIVPAKDKKFVGVARNGEDIVAVYGAEVTIKAVLPKILDMLRGIYLRCPKCGLILTLIPYLCPGCHHYIAFGEAVCHFCGYVETSRPCPNCGTFIRLARSFDVASVGFTRIRVEKPKRVEITVEAEGVSPTKGRILVCGAGVAGLVYTAAVTSILVGASPPVIGLLTAPWIGLIIGGFIGFKRRS